MIIHGPEKGKDTKEPNATTKKSPPTKSFVNSPDKNGKPREEGKSLRNCETEFLTKTHLKCLTGLWRY